MIAVARMPIPDLVAQWSCERAERPLEPHLERIFRSRLLDFTANVVGGAATPASILIQRYTARFPGAIAVPGGHGAAAEAAALAYGVAAHALECDDTHQPSSSHPGAVIFAAALPLAVELDATLADVARAVVVGYEVMCRLGEAAGPAEQYARGFHPTGTCGVFGATAAAGVLLGLSSQQLAAGLGIAGSFSSGSMAFLQGGGWSKLLNAGHAAGSGITVALLAGSGYAAPDESIVGPHGFLAGHSSEQQLDLLDFGGEPSAIERTSIKAHGCCRYEQGPIDAILQLRDTHGFGAEAVESVRVGMLSAGWGIVAEPLDAKRRPATIVQSQFSMPFGVALAIVHGRAAPTDHSEANLVDPELHRVMDHVECYRDPELDAQYPGRWPTVVQIRLRDGTQLEERVDFPKGDPENPLSDDELLDKLRAIVPNVPDSDIQSLAHLAFEEELGGTKASALVAQLSSMWREAS
jgi:2-methylcitrate dehydratase PrpD